MTYRLIILYLLLLIFQGQTHALPAPGNEPDPALRNSVAAGIYQAATHFRFADAEELIRKNDGLFRHDPQYELAVINYYWWRFISGNDNRAFAGKINARIAGLRQAGQNEASPGDYPRLFSLVSAYAFEARVSLADYAYLKAMRSLSNYYALVKTSFGRETAYSPFYLTTGLFNFFAGFGRESYPVFRPVLGMYYKGTKEQGYQYLLKAASDNDPAVSQEANYFLMKINFDIFSDYAESEKYCRMLILRYPGNLLFQYYLFRIFLAGEQLSMARKQLLVISYYADKNPQLTADEKQYFVDEAKKEFRGYKAK